MKEKSSASEFDKMHTEKYKGILLQIHLRPNASKWDIEIMILPTKRNVIDIASIVKISFLADENAD
jgi:hypothetical protein